MYINKNDRKVRANKIKPGDEYVEPDITKSQFFKDVEISDCQSPMYGTWARRFVYDGEFVRINTTDGSIYPRNREEAYFMHVWNKMGKLVF